MQTARGVAYADGPPARGGGGLPISAAPANHCTCIDVDEWPRSVDAIFYSPHETCPLRPRDVSTAVSGRSGP
jgi:hypothetical protein